VLEALATAGTSRRHKEASCTTGKRSERDEGGGINGYGGRGEKKKIHSEIKTSIQTGLRLCEEAKDLGCWGMGEGRRKRGRAAGYGDETEKSDRTKKDNGCRRRSIGPVGGCHKKKEKQTMAGGELGSHGKRGNRVIKQCRRQRWEIRREEFVSTPGRASSGKGKRTSISYRKKTPCCLEERRVEKGWVEKAGEQKMTNKGVKRKRKVDRGLKGSSPTARVRSKKKE